MWLETLVPNNRLLALLPQRPALRAVETHSAVCRATASSSSCSDGGSGASDDGAANPPWVLANYYTKKLERRTDSLGNISSSPDTIAEGPGWTREAQLRLAAQALAAELQQDAAVLLDQARHPPAAWRCDRGFPTLLGFGWPSAIPGIPSQEPHHIASFPLRRCGSCTPCCPPWRYS